MRSASAEDVAMWAIGATAYSNSHSRTPAEGLLPWLNPIDGWVGLYWNSSQNRIDFCHSGSSLCRVRPSSAVLIFHNGPRTEWGFCWNMWDWFPLSFASFSDYYLEKTFQGAADYWAIKGCSQTGSWILIHTEMFLICIALSLIGIVYCWIHWISNMYT